MNIKTNTMKQHLVDTYTKVELTQQQIDKIYFTLVDYVKTQNNVDRLYELSPDQDKEYKTELEIINKFVGL